VRIVAASSPTTGIASWESPRAAPWPGKCFSTAATPAAWSPRVIAAARPATRAGSDPKGRVPSGVAELGVSTSQTGAKTIVAPMAAASAPIAAPAACASRWLAVAPSARFPGQAVAPWPTACSWPPSWSMPMTSGGSPAGRAAWSAAHAARS